MYCASTYLAAGFPRSHDPARQPEVDSFFACRKKCVFRGPVQCFLSKCSSGHLESSFDNTVQNFLLKVWKRFKSFRLFQKTCWKCFYGRVEVIFENTGFCLSLYLLCRGCICFSWNCEPFLCRAISDPPWTEKNRSAAASRYIYSWFGL